MFKNVTLQIFILFLCSCIHANPSSYGPVGQESLHDIALQFSEDSPYTSEQWVVSIWQSNPRSFAKQNLFAIIPNSVLKIPSENTVKNISHDIAVATIHNQLQHWQILFQQDPESSRVPAPYIAFKANNTLNINQEAEQPRVAKAKTTILDGFLLTFLRGSHYLQHKIQIISAAFVSRQVIPMMVITSGVGLLVCTLWFAVTSAKKEQRNKAKSVITGDSSSIVTHHEKGALSLQDTEDQSDFNVFTTQEGIPIKLDLARAYITMRDIAGARSILQEIIELHPGDVACEAKNMLAEIT